MSLKTHAHAVARRAFVLFTLLFCTGSISTAFAQDASLRAMEHEVFDDVNQHRAEIGQPPLIWNDMLTEKAEEHSSDMATGKVPFGHEGFEERMGAIMKQLAPANAAAENVADGNLVAKGAVELWLKSAGHRKNIEGNFNVTGVGIVRSKDGMLYFTQIFIHKQ